MKHSIRKLTWLIWKNFILQSRRPIGTVIEILMPVALLALLVLARKMIKLERQCLSLPLAQPIEEQNYISSYINMAQIKPNNFSLAYFPINENTTQILQLFSKETNVLLATKDMNGHRFLTKEQVISDAEKFTDRYLGAVTFDNVVSGQPLPNKIKYSIRLHHTMAELFSDSNDPKATWYTRWVYPFYQDVGPKGGTFYYSPFMTLQYYVDTGILQFRVKNQSITAAQYIQQFPYPAYTKDTFITLVQSMVPIIFILGYMYTAIMIVKELISERQLQMKEMMKIMGLSNWMHWTAWFIKFTVFFLITIILQAVVLKVGKIFQYANVGVLLIFLILYMTSSIFFLFFLSTIFSNAIRGMLFAAVIWFGSLGPYLSFSQAEKYEELSHGNKFASCLLPNTCLGIIVQIISRRESSQVGADWNNINKATSVDDNFTLAEAFAVLILDCFIYAILTWYIENVHPGDFGIPQPLYFPFQPSYWCSGFTESHEDNSHLKPFENPDVEKAPEDLPVGICIKGLNKHFTGLSKTSIAVDDLSLNMYKGQITALLGHNGAGKTTTISILTGLFPPSSGSAYIDGKSVLSQIESIRKSLGLCPQRNVLFDQLTVKEHLKFFSALKGVESKKATSDIDKMIEDFGLDGAKKSSILSGGMKRKLCCAIALIGDSKTVFLDEPTTGMDVETRRTFWNLLKKYKKGKTIVLTTHFMDEADYLGDRIAIIAYGKLRCCGSPFFLKQRYGDYEMTITKGQSYESEKQVSEDINRLIPDAEFLKNSESQSELKYILKQKDKGKFPKLFEYLEQTQQVYEKFDISVPTMEEVFLKVVHKAENEISNKANPQSSQNADESTFGKKKKQEGSIETIPLLGYSNPTYSGSYTHVTEQKVELAVKETFDDKRNGCSRRFKQFEAMFIKRFLNSVREKKALFTKIILPLLLVLCGLFLSMSQDGQKDDGKRLLSLSMLKSKSNKLMGFYADIKTTESLGYFREIARNVYASVDVDMVDITNKVNLIRDQNMNNHMGLPFTKNKYSANFSAGFKECCNYKYLILNKKCREELTINEQLCSEDDLNFAYGQCMRCAYPNAPSKCSLTPTINSENDEGSKLYFEEYILEDSDKYLKNYFNQKVAGLSVENDQYTVWFSNEAWHTLPSAFSAASNILLKYYTGNEDYAIQSYNYPLPRNSKEKESGSASINGNLTLIIFVTMAACFVAASFVTFLVEEKISKAKHIQFVSGVNSLCYWGATYCWDYLNYIIPAIGILILFAAFNLDDYQGELGEVFLVLMLFGLSMLPFVYMLSFVFNSSLFGYAVIAILLMVISLALVIATYILRVTGEVETANYVRYIFLLLPTYAFPQALSDIAVNAGYRKMCSASSSSKLYCKRLGVTYQEDTLKWSYPGIGIHCFYMFLESIVFFGLTILIEEQFCFGSCVRAWQRPKDLNQNNEEEEIEDGDVKKEREKVNEPGSIQNFAVLIKDLTKIYRSSSVRAVDRLNVAIPKAECFGLLGVNGAGKTTTFGMLTGDIGISSGAAYVLGHDIGIRLRGVQVSIGYCPQFDGLIETLTGREMLEMFARIRGFPSHSIQSEVSAKIDQLDLSKDADKLCGEYSGGNKRKLSAATALIGSPDVIFLDEPSSGMDPAARNYLKDTLNKVKENKRTSIMLTSHSIEECEALCTRLAIMVNGKFKCIGKQQHLKRKFGQSYNVTMKICSYLEMPNGYIQTKHFLSQKYQDVTMMEERSGFLKCKIKDPHVSFSTLLTMLKENASQLGILNCTINVQNEQAYTICINIAEMDQQQKECEHGNSESGSTGAPGIQVRFPEIINERKQFLDDISNRCQLINEEDSLLLYKVIDVSDSLEWMDTLENIDIKDYSIHVFSNLYENLNQEPTHADTNNATQLHNIQKSQTNPLKDFLTQTFTEIYILKEEQSFIKCQIKDNISCSKLLASLKEKMSELRIVRCTMNIVEGLRYTLSITIYESDSSEEINALDNIQIEYPGNLKQTNQFLADYSKPLELLRKEKGFLFYRIKDVQSVQWFDLLNDEASKLQIDCAVHVNPSLLEDLNLDQAADERETKDMHDVIENTRKVQKFMKDKFPKCELTHEKLGFLQYEIEKDQISYSKLFGEFEKFAPKYGIIDYSLGQPTLEQIFIKLTQSSATDWEILENILLEI